MLYTNLLLELQEPLKGNRLMIFLASIPYLNRGYVGKPPHSLTPQNQLFLCDSMEERVDVGVASPKRVGASMDIKIFYGYIIFVWIVNYFDLIASKIESHDCMISFKLSHCSRIVPRQAWVFLDQSTSGLIADWWATKRSIHQCNRLHIQFY